MSGTIRVSGESSWTVASWLFDWVVNRIAELVESEPVRLELCSIVENNFGYLDFAEFDEKEREALAGAIRSSLYGVAVDRLALREGFNKAEALSRILELVSLVSVGII
jgi:hypothetical protein